MTIAEASDATGKSTKALYQAIKDERLQARRLRDHWEIEPADLAKYVDQARKPPDRKQLVKPDGVRPGKSRFELAILALGDCSRDQLYAALKHGYCALADDKIRAEFKDMIAYQDSLRGPRTRG